MNRLSTIFLVDDEPLGLECRAAVLESCLPCVVQRFSLATAALAAIATAQCDLLITDYFMPVLRGDELARKAKLLNPALPIIMISGDSAVPSLVTCAADSFIEKSSSVPDFVAAISRYLRKPH